jgi:hypothetical protein
VRTEVRTVTVPAGTPLPVTTDSDVRRFSESIGGHVAELYRNRVEGKYYTGVQWSTPHVWFTGQASSSDVADLEVKIFRTVHFSQ